MQSDKNYKLDLILNTQINFDFGKYFERGWEIFIKNMAQYIAFTAIFIGIFLLNSLIAKGIPGGDSILNMITSPVLTAGLYLVIYYSTKDKINFSQFFDGSNYFVPLLIYSVISSIFIIVGIFALVIPGIYLSVAYAFSIFFIIFHKLDFWQAMEYSRKIITKKWWSFFGLFLVLGLLNAVGAFFLLIGVLFTLPFSYCVIYAAYEDIIINNTIE